MRLRHGAHLLLGNKSVFLVSSRKGHLLGGGSVAYLNLFSMDMVLSVRV